MYTVAKKVDGVWTIISEPFHTIKWAVVTAMGCQSDFDKLNNQMKELEKRSDLQNRRAQYGVFEAGNLILETTQLS